MKDMEDEWVRRERLCDQKFCVDIEKGLRPKTVLLYLEWSDDWCEFFNFRFLFYFKIAQIVW